MKRYRAAVIGCSRMGGFIDNEVAGSRWHVPPYSHAAGFVACPRTELVACADLRTDVMERFGERYHVPKERQYTDYREMIRREQPDIVSVATQPEPRAEIVIFAAENGVRAIYAEKAMAASLAEADAMVEAVERHGIAFNLGTNRRWSPIYEHMKAAIDRGAVGKLQTLIVYHNGTLFNTASHTFDLLLYLNNDQPVSWVQAHLPNDDVPQTGDILPVDPVGMGTIHFANGVTAHALLTARGLEVEAIGDEGSLTALNDGQEWLYRTRQVIDAGNRKGLVATPFAGVEPASSTLRLIEDLVHALDTGEPTRGGPRVALAGMEIIFGFIASHRRGGARVRLPLTERSLRLQRSVAPHQPKFDVQGAS
ncbi:Gfo/Idh/MocA family oxidoreductase [Litorilinea aerophila]|uniref:Gfo/Idh/MocA family oxidoreductase n=1 Tax=Litorilinea aerophila TaxID=1204385 RepID=A0A540VIW9_9CHLR|nr:Gfo/Idh/MocA family oxidoreductase [Litorilinea aerophila]MCC9075574.1 Gfo/Idh/MocA family oxidoreductase [Litorilinea aerophila]